MTSSLSNTLTASRALFPSRVRTFCAALLVVTTATTIVISNPRHANAAARLPWWWNGSVCDAGRNSSFHPLGASYLGVQVCGPQPYKYNGGNSFAMVNIGPDPAHTFGEGEWQCVELAMRFMALVYGVQPYGANGDSVVDNYSISDGGGLVKYLNGTPGIAPLPGDVISFSDSISVGHVGVVTESAVDERGNGSITMMSENDTDDGWRTLAVTDWRVAGFTHHSARGWLHDPAGQGAGFDPSDRGSIAARPTGGYWAVTPEGKVTGVQAPFYGDASTRALNAPIVDIAATPSGKGYWLLGGDGGIFSFGNVRFNGSTSGTLLAHPVSDMARTPTDAATGSSNRTA